MVTFQLPWWVRGRIKNDLVPHQGDFPGGPVVKTLHSQRRGHGSNRASKIPYVTWHSKKTRQQQQQKLCLSYYFNCEKQIVERKQHYFKGNTCWWVREPLAVPQPNMTHWKDAYSLYIGGWVGALEFRPVGRAGLKFLLNGILPKILIKMLTDPIKEWGGVLLMEFTEGYYCCCC